MFSPIIRSTWLYLQYLLTFTNVAAAGWCLGRVVTTVRTLPSHQPGDVFAHHQEHLAVFTVSVNVHQCRCRRLVSWKSCNYSSNSSKSPAGRCFRPSSGALGCIYSIC